MYQALIINVLSIATRRLHINFSSLIISFLNFSTFICHSILCKLKHLIFNLIKNVIQSCFITFSESMANFCASDYFNVIINALKVLT